MFKKILSILILTTLIFSINSALASESSLKYTQSVRAKIIDNFKNEQYDNIFDSDNVLLSKKEDLNFFETINKNEKFEKIRQKLLEAKKEVEEKKDSLTVRRLNLEQTVAELDSEIDTTTLEIASLNREVLKLSAEVTNLESQVLELQKEIAESKKVLLEYISHIYKKQNIIFK
jgi:chromosome segregation ATPase